MRAHLSELYGSRELLRNFLTRDIRVRYKGSALGIVWSLLNPVLMMAVYTVVFSTFMRSGAPHYPVYFLSGFLPWTFFAAALQMGAFALVSHTALIQKVYFPREVLPLSMTIANLVNMGIGLAVFVPVAIYVAGAISVPGLLALIPVTVGLFLCAAGLAMLFSVLMVYFRDVEFLLGIGLTVWFFATPIVYTPGTITGSFSRILDFNPVRPFIDSYHDALYSSQAPSAATIALCLAIGVGTFWVGYAIFNRLQGRIAEEL